MIPAPGDIVLITPQAGAQFRIFGAGLQLRVTRVEQYATTPDHMVYLAGYHLNSDGEAVEHRPMLLVEHAGVELVRRSTAARPRNTGPVRIPRQRVSNELGEPARPKRRITNA